MSGDTRPDPFADGRLVPHELADFGDPLLPPTHPNGPRKMRPVTLDELGPDVVQPHDAIAAAQLAAYAEPAPGAKYTAPKPPPAELGFDLTKWRHMSRAERRAMLRATRKGIDELRGRS